ncbi:MAG: oligopeptide ABC transporter permease [Bacilli bacterium]
MGRYVLKRLGYMVVTLFIIASATFFLMKLLPGSPFRNQEKLTETQREILNEKYGLNDSYAVQYFNYMTGLIKGDLGTSFQFDNREVSEILVARVGPSAQLGIQALLVGAAIGIFLGAIAALRRNTWVDYSATLFSVLGISVPSFVFAALLQYYVGLKWGLFPIAYWDTWEHTILPTTALAVFVIATTARFMRTEMIEVLGSDYIVTAKAKGLSQPRILVTHALRNALIPIITVMGPMAVNLMTGSLIVEKIFAVPGLGEQFVLSINTRDYPIIMGLTVLYSTMLLGVILLVDILYGVIDPRIRLVGGKK